jgi:hypothetical protein
MFRKPPDRPDAIEVVVEGVSLRVPPGTTAAAAALLAGLPSTRTSPVTGEPRAPYCLMGVCFECLLVIDGVPSRQGCLVTVRPGMTIRRQEGARSL